MNNATWFGRCKTCALPHRIAPVAAVLHLGHATTMPLNNRCGAHTNTSGRKTKLRTSAGLSRDLPVACLELLTCSTSFRGSLGCTHGPVRNWSSPLSIARFNVSIYSGDNRSVQDMPLPSCTSELSTCAAPIRAELCDEADLDAEDTSCMKWSNVRCFESRLATGSEVLSATPPRFETELADCDARGFRSAFFTKRPPLNT